LGYGPPLGGMPAAVPERGQPASRASSGSFSRARVFARSWVSREVSGSTCSAWRITAKHYMENYILPEAPMS
jgi:hypothetical protein